MAKPKRRKRTTTEDENAETASGTKDKNRNRLPEPTRTKRELPPRESGRRRYPLAVPLPLPTPPSRSRKTRQGSSPVNCGSPASRPDDRGDHPCSTGDSYSMGGHAELGRPLQHLARGRQRVWPAAAAEESILPLPQTRKRPGSRPPGVTPAPRNPTAPEAAIRRRCALRSGW